MYMFYALYSNRNAIKCKHEKKGQRPVPLADKELLAFPLLNRLDLRRVGPLEFLLGDDMIFTSISGAFKEKLRCNFIETLEEHSVNAVDEM